MPCLSLSFHLRPTPSDTIAKLPPLLKDFVAALVTNSPGVSETNPGVNKGFEWSRVVKFGLLMRCAFTVVWSVDMFETLAWT